VATVVPPEDYVRTWAKQHQVVGDYRDLCDSEKLQAAVLESFHNIAREQKLGSFENIASVTLEPIAFIARGFLTPTLQLKRAKLLASD